MASRLMSTEARALIVATAAIRVAAAAAPSAVTTSAAIGAACGARTAPAPVAGARAHVFLMKVRASIAMTAHCHLEVAAEPNILASVIGVPVRSP